MSALQTLEVPVSGMDCAECTQHVHKAIAALPGVLTVDVFLATEKAVIQLDPAQVGMPAIRQAVSAAGYAVPEDLPARTDGLESNPVDESSSRRYSRTVLGLLGFMFASVLFVVVVGEWLGLFAWLNDLLPLWAGAILVIAAGYPVFRKVALATLRRQVIAHTLMTLGVLAALAVGEWVTALVVVFFMRVGDYVERFTTERARRAVRDLAAFAPQTARLEREGQEITLPVSEVQPGEIVIVRPGERIPVDGIVVAGQASVDQATITGEALPFEAGPGAQVYAATLATLGSLRVRAEHVGPETTFGKVIHLVEQAEAHRADVQRLADRFSAYYLPVVAGVALLTLLLRRDPIAAAAVLVVACSCAFALATPIAMLASIGAAAQHGLLIKGGKYLESLAQADTLLIDKTGTLTLGKPEIVAMHWLDPNRASEGLRLAASAERYSEHPLAEAVRQAASREKLILYEPQDFQALPGRGVRARVAGRQVQVGRQSLFADTSADLLSALSQQITAWLGEGRTLLYVWLDGKLAGVLAAGDTLRPETTQALEQVRRLGFAHLELLTGDNPRSAAELAGRLGIAFRADLLPQDKIEIVRQYQASGHRVVMVGDGVNDAPALAQAEVGIAMGAAGSDLAIEAAHIAVLRDDWRGVPQVIQIARRTMRVVKGNLGFTIAYNFLGLSLAAFGILPPIYAAAAQSLPDIGILLNSARLLKQ